MKQLSIPVQDVVYLFPLPTTPLPSNTGVTPLHKLQAGDHTERKRSWSGATTIAPMVH